MNISLTAEQIFYNQLLIDETPQSFHELFNDIIKSYLIRAEAVSILHINDLDQRRVKIAQINITYQEQLKAEIMKWHNLIAAKKEEIINNNLQYDRKSEERKEYLKTFNPSYVDIVESLVCQYTKSMVKSSIQRAEY